MTTNQVLTHYAAATTNATGYAAMVQADNPKLYFRLDEPPLPITANLGSLGSSVDGKMIAPAVSADPGPRSPALPGFESSNVGVAVAGADASGVAGGYVSVPALYLNTNAVTITCGGADTLNTVGGSTSGTLPRESARQPAGPVEARA